MPKEPQNSLIVLPPIPDQKEMTRRDRVSLRAMCQEAVHEFTILRRRQATDDFVEKHERPPTEDELDRIQPLMEEFDPVVELAILSADHRNEPALRAQAANAAAQYLRPKLSAVTMMEDPETLAAAASKRELAVKLLGVMNMVAMATKMRDVPVESTLSS